MPLCPLVMTTGSCIAREPTAVRVPGCRPCITMTILLVFTMILLVGPGHASGQDLLEIPAGSTGDIADLIEYTIHNGSVRYVVPDPESNSLVIGLRDAGEGVMDLTIPRDVLDVWPDNLDEDQLDMFALTDKNEIWFQDLSNDEYWVFLLEFPAGAETMEIVGEYSNDIADLIEYEIYNGSMLYVEPDPESNSLLIGIRDTGNGTLTLMIPRTVFDARTDDGEDAELFVLVDRAEVTFEETATNADRTLVIEFPAGSKTVEIVGTFVIPEFETIAIMVLAMAVMSIAVMRKTPPLNWR